MTKTKNDSTSRKRIITVVIGVLLSLFLLEILSVIYLNFIASEEESLNYSLYTYLRPDNQRYIPHHYLNYYPNPEYDRKGTFHNSLGFRNSEIADVKPKNEFRIVAIGGSSTYTIKVKRNEETFTSQLEEILKNDYGYNNIAVINAGVGGYNSWESLINLEFRVLDLDPDLIIVYHGTNDVHTRFVDPEFYRGDNSGRRKQWIAPGIPLLEHSTFFRILFRKSGLTNQIGIGNFVNSDNSYQHNRVGDKNPFDLLAKNPPIYFKRNLNNMVAISKANGADIMLATWAHSPEFDDYASTPYYQQGFKENNEVVKEVGEINNIPIFDFASVMPKDKEYWADGRHVNEHGARRKAELFAEFIHNSGIIKNSD